MKKTLITISILLLPLFAYGYGLVNLGASWTPASVQFAPSPVSGYVLQTNGTTNSWVPNINFGTTSANYWIGTYDKGFFFSTTSSDYWIGAKNHDIGGYDLVNIGKIGMGTSTPYGILDIYNGNGDDTGGIVFDSSLIGQNYYLYNTGTDFKIKINNDGSNGNDFLLQTASENGGPYLRYNFDLGSIDLVNNQATSSFGEYGIDLNGGCFSIGGVCITGGTTNGVADGTWSTTSANYWETTLNNASTTLLADNNTWTGNNIFGNATSSTFGITGLGTPAGSFLAVNANGSVIATTTPISALTPWVSNIDAATFNLLNAGKIGLGTSTPFSAVDIFGTGNSAGGISLDINDGSSPFRIYNSGGDVVHFAVPTIARAPIEIDFMAEDSPDNIYMVLNNGSADLNVMGTTSTKGIDLSTFGGTFPIKFSDGTYQFTAAVPYGDSNVNSYLLTQDNGRFFSTTSSDWWFNGALNGTTTLSTITSAPSLSILKAQVSDFGTYEAPLTFNYPLTRSTNTISLAFGTTTANSWSALQQFNGNASTTQLTTTGSTYLATTGGNVGIGTTSPYSKLSVEGQVVAQNFVATSTTVNSSFKQASTTQLSVSGLSWFGNNINVTGDITNSNNIHLGNAIYIGGGTTDRLAYGNGGNYFFGNSGVSAAPSGGDVAVGDTTLAVDQGNLNTAIGAAALTANSSGVRNTATGYSALASNVSGSNNTANGLFALNSSLGTGNVGLGYFAGAYETGGDTLYIDNQDRSNTAGDKAKALIYGQFAAAAANQNLTINAHLNVTGTSTLSNNAYLATSASSKVGIGTTSPLSKLNIVGDSGSTVQLLLQNNDYIADVIGTGISLITGASSGNTYGQLQVYTNGDAKGGDLALNNQGGNVGIGTTSPGAKFTVWGKGTGNNVHLSSFMDSASSTLMTIMEGGYIGIGTTSPSSKLTVWGTGTGSNTLANFVNSASTSVLSLLENGHVGFGIDVPNSLVEIHGATASGNSGNLFISSNESMAVNKGGSISFGGNSSGLAPSQWAAIRGLKENSTDSNSAAYLTFETRAAGSNIAEKMRLTSTGNVGIGTTSPGAKLDIYGTAVSTSILSSANVAHGMTGWAPTNAYGSLGSNDTNNGGLLLTGFSDNAGQTGLDMYGFIGATDPTDSVAALSLHGSKSNGSTGQAAVGALETAIQFLTASTPIMTMLGSGNVGIGVTNPVSYLDIKASDNTASNIKAGGLEIQSTGANNGFLSDNLYYGSGWKYRANGAAAQVYFGASSAGSIDFRSAPTGTAGNTATIATNMTILQGGNVGIGSTSPATLLDVNGTITQLTVKSCTLGLTTNALGSITGCVASDEKLKKNILPLSTSLGTLLKLSPVTYEWKDASRDTQVHAGFVAQQVDRVFHQAVVSAGTDTKGVDPNAILSLVVNSIKDFYAKFQALVARVSGLEDRVDKQDAKIKELERIIKSIKR